MPEEVLDCRTRGRSQHVGAQRDAQNRVGVNREQEAIEQRDGLTERINRTESARQVAGRFMRIVTSKSRVFGPQSDWLEASRPRNSTALGVHVKQA